MRSAGTSRSLSAAAGLAAAVLGPVALTAILVPLRAPQPRDYAFLYLGVVALLGVGRGLAPALLAAASSFLLVDFFFVPPVHTLTISDEQDLANLLVFFGAAGLVGGVGSRRRRSQLAAEALTEQLRRANDELARLNREQAEAAAVAVRLARTEQQVRVLEESDRVRRDLLANVSHELRTPLGSILTNSTGLLSDAALAPGLHGEVESIATEARRLNRLVGDMLDMARIEGNALTLHLEPVDVGAAVEASVERLHVSSPHRTVDWEGDPPGLQVVADWDRLGQVLDNLLRNADRAAPEGTPITVRAARGARSMIVVRVSDQGPGVPEELRSRLFSRFVRGDTSDANGGGAGLGLAIVRGLVEAHAGRVWLEDTPGRSGASFAFSLPAAPS
jgi:two-component system, OmpR family, sensor histidine kinase KdpD